MDDLIKALGCDGISSSQVSRICEQLDEVVESFLGRPLDDGPYPYVWLDGLTQKVREGGRIVNVCVVVATGVNAEGQREILGMDVGASEDGAFWLAFLRSLTARGLSGVELLTSDAHHRRTYRCIRRQPNANKADDGDRNRPFPPGRLLLTVSANGKSDRPDDHRTRSNPHGNKVLPQVHVHQFPAAPAAGRSVPAAIAAAINTNRSWCQVHDSVP